MTVALRGRARIDLREDLAQRYDAGASIRTLATQEHRSYGFTRTLLLEAGVELRPRHHRAPTNQPPTQPPTGYGRSHA
ncbi:helix-turn-helix domain-containing protein [Streptomyces liangshanensis]|uniref:helix-turn-helix domain-containing protein n=1 Tax=Streptomyces liangshanensis TaxID=2717324 RepID=UPI0036D964B4